MAPTDLDPFTAHGGRVEAARAAFGGEGWIDLSTGIAPWRYRVGDGLVDDENPPPEGEGDQPQAGGGVDHVSAQPFASGVATPPPARGWSPSPCRGGFLGLDRLPEPGALAALEQAARAAFGVPAGREAVAVPGTDLAMRLLARLIPARRIAVVRPGYAGHAAAWPGMAGVSAGEARTVAADLIVLANPNNPDGHRFDRATLLDMAARATLIVDEAFADADPQASVADAEGAIVLRSFGKFYGLPGLRLGFAVAPRAVAADLRAMLGDWPVSTAAIAIGTAAYADCGWQAAQRRRIAEAGARLDAALGRIPVIGGTSLFRLVEVADAHRLFRHLASRAILARPFADRQDRLRLGLPRDAAAAARLAAAIEEYRP